MMYRATVYYLDDNGQPGMMSGNFKSELKRFSQIYF